MVLTVSKTLHKIYAIAGEFVAIASQYLHGFDSLSGAAVDTMCIDCFGISPTHIAWVWTILVDNFIDDSTAREIHLLWTLDLLKSDATLRQLHGRWDGSAVGTIRTRIDQMLEWMYDMDVVSVLLYR